MKQLMDNIIHALERLGLEAVLADSDHLQVELSVTGCPSVLAVFEREIILEFGQVHRLVLDDGILTFGPESGGAILGILRRWVMNLEQYQRTLFKRRLEEITGRAVEEGINPASLLEWLDEEITRRVQRRHERATHRRESTRTNWRSDR